MFPALCCSKLPSWVCLGKGSHNCKEQYCIGTWNVKSMNQGKLEEVKQEIARVNVNSLGISELKWTGMGEFNSDDPYIYYCGQESIMVNKRVWNAVLGTAQHKSKYFQDSHHHRWVLPGSEIQIKGIIQMYSFFTQLSLSKLVFMRFIHIIVCDNGPKILSKWQEELASATGLQMIRVIPTAAP